MLVCLFALLVYDLISWCTSFSFFFLLIANTEKCLFFFVAVVVKQSASAKIHLLLLRDLSGAVNAALARQKKTLNATVRC